jgi:transposase
VAYDRVKDLPTVERIPDEIWDEIRMILPPEKPDNTIGCPVVSFRKVLESILYVIKNWMSMEDAAKRIWLRFDVS